MSEISFSLLKDSFKQLYDLFKHITTLDTGAIVILATFFSKSFDNTSKNWLVMLCVITIIISLVSCVIGMVAVTMSMAAVGSEKSFDKQINNSANITFAAFIFSIVSFVVGVILLALFILANIKV
jgi:hypothetical protein